VLEAGYGLASGRWREAQAAIARTNRVCSYDRQGVGRSDVRPDDVDRTPAEGLHALLRAIGLPPPYVLAGHSLGGAFITAYAGRYPDDAVGLVFVDAVDPREIGGGAASEGRGTLELGPVADEIGKADAARLPVAVLERGQGRNAAWSEAQAELARLSPNTVHAVAVKSAHHVQAGQPAVVAAAVRAVAEAGTRGTRLPPCARIFSGLAVSCRTR